MSKNDFITFWVLPKVKPIFVYFDHLGIHYLTVIGVPAILILSLSLKRSKKRSVDYFITIAIIAFLAIVAIYFQLKKTLYGYSDIF